MPPNLALEGVETQKLLGNNRLDGLKKFQMIYLNHSVWKALQSHCWEAIAEKEMKMTCVWIVVAFFSSLRVIG